MSADTSPSIRDNILRLREEIARAAIQSGRAPEAVTFLAATKTQGAERIRQALEAGVDAVGENRVQEMLAKPEAYTGADLHFIGRLQRNKIKDVVGRVSLIHSVESLAQAGDISACALRRELRQDILLEVNLGREDSKGGFLPEELWDKLCEISEMKGLRVRGLMCIPPKSGSAPEDAKYFLQMKQLYVDIRPKIIDNIRNVSEKDFSVLSMGMSEDYIQAVLCGSTLVRLGSAVFGPR